MKEEYQMLKFMNYTKWLVCLLFVVLMIGTVLSQEEEAMVEGEEVLEELQEALKWDDETTQKVGKAMENFKTNMATTMAKYEDDENADPQKMIGDMKKVRGDYQKELEGILGKDGLKAYNEYVEKVMLEIFSDIAEIRLLDLKPKTSLTDEQIEELAPPMGKGYLDLMRTIMKYGDKKMNKRTQIKMGKELKKIQSDIQTALNKTLTEEQQAALAKYKEEQKNK
jgi:hypothetical protein